MKNNLKGRGFKALIVTQFLGAFNDNAFKLVISFLAVEKIAGSPGGAQYLSAASAFFILPFLVFSTYAGYLADKVSKRTIMIYAKFAEIVIMFLGFFAIRSGNFNYIYLVLFLIGTHSAFFAPAKYGILPEVLNDEELSEGNGLLQMWTFLAIIAGTASASFLVAVAKGKVYLTSMLFITIAIVGAISSFFIFKAPPGGTKRRFQINFVKDIYDSILAIRKKRAMRLSMAGTVYFWFLGAIFQLNILMYATKMMKISEVATGILLIVVAVGVGLGSFVAGKLSGRKIEFGFVPMGSIGLSIFSILLAFSYKSFFCTSVCLFFIGISSGFFVIPLNAYIQEKSPSDAKGRFLSTINFMSFIGILAASGMLWFMLEVLKLSPAGAFGFIGLLTVIGTVYIVGLLPTSLIRLFLWMLTHSIYRIRAVETENVPKNGGALLISNHVSFVDALLISACLQRHVRFIMMREIYNIPVLKWFCKMMKAIPISAKDSPKQMVAALKTARDAVSKGELVCIFPEGHLTLTGHVRRFKRGVSEITKGVEAPVIPIYLDRIWGSIFSFKGDKFFFKIPKKIPYPVTVMFGKGIPSSSSAYELRQAVRELGADAYKYRVGEKVPLHIAFWGEARRSFYKFCMSDFTGKKFTYATTLISSLVTAQILKNKCNGNKRVGVLLPPTCFGALTNIALSILEKTVVNLNYTASEEIINSIVDKCGIKTIVTSRKFIEKVNIKEREGMVFAEDVLKEVSIKQKANAIICGFFLPVKLSIRLLAGKKRVKMNDIATIIFSSGSTGVPKGIMLSHSNITANIEGLYQVFNIEEHDKFLGILPFFHSFGYMATLWFPLISGIGVVYHLNPTDAGQIGNLVSKYHVTILLSTPTFLNFYMRKCTPEQFKSLRIVLVGAEKLSNESARAFEEKYGVMPMEGYGATELSPIVSVNLPNRREAGQQITHKLGKIGLPLPGIAVKVVNHETMEELDADKEGLLLVKGQNVMTGYLDDPEKTKEVIRDGWYVTGDIAAIDSDGFLQITDRLSRFSKIGGEMVPHIKIEEEIQSFLKTEERKCVVTSVKDEKRGEQLAVIYQGDMNVDEVWTKLSESGMPKLWIPKKDAFYKMDALPILGSGKIDLVAIRKMAEEKSKIL